MNTTAIGTPTGVRIAERAVAKTSTVPWLSWAGLIASAGIATGVYWDISWHETIGRDSFWTPAHLLIQFGAVIAGLASSYVIFKTTFGRDSAAKQISVNVLGFRGPLGAFILAWGGAAMLTSAPFDDWWHQAYGLDVKIISPPHMLLALGIFGINWGSVFLTVALLNRAGGTERKRLEYLLMATGGFIIVQLMTLKLEWTSRTLQHSAISYLVTVIGLLFMVEALARVTGHRWARTIMTGVYTAFCLLMLWILPLFPAQPKLGPVYQKIDHMVPLPFPVMIMAGAFAVDLLWPRIKNASIWKQSVVGGVAFLAALIAVQWPLATLIMSPAGDNWFFHHNNYPYFAQSNWPDVQHIFLKNEATITAFWVMMGMAFVASVINVWLGLIFGNWLAKVRR
ncbi:MAG TPA: hypothetical protein VKW06_04305 [Candidatus Angelobacter sp.]|nr:hypothetical protein [Candidatus Angelobacter sp.]